MLHVALLLACLVITAVCGARAVSAFKDGRLRVGVRQTGWALLPVGAYLAGLVTLVSRIGSAISRWVLNLVFNPITWTGLVLMLVAVALLAGSGVRPPGRSRRADDGRDPADLPSTL